jgi:N-acetylglucosamine-6-phosphate deacetylase
MEKLIAKNPFDNQVYELFLDKGEIRKLQPISTHEDPKLFWGPGFYDIQVNGFGGIDYNEVQADFLTLGQITERLLQLGVTAHFPTVITNSRTRIHQLISQIRQLLDNDPKARKCIPGIHLEGPFISPEDGPRGAHFREFVQASDWELFQSWQEAANGEIRLVTLSPEWENAPEFIKKCVDSGVLVAIGHTKASHAEIEKALDAGARMSTHLGNGAHAMLPRHPNYLWSQLAEDRLWASIIADGFHLPREVIQVFKKVKGEKLFFVSDSVALAGLPAGDYDTTVGGKVTLSLEGKLHLRDNPQVLAGSAGSLLQGVGFLIKNNLATLKEAWEMASTRPRSLFETGIKNWTPRIDSDSIILEVDAASNLKLHKTFKNGKEVFSSNPNP